MAKANAVPLKVVPGDANPLQEFQNATNGPDVVAPLYGGTGLTTADLTGKAGYLVQVNTSADGYTAVASGDLVQYCRWRGIVGTTATHPTSPREGDLYYNSADTKVRLYANGTWIDLT